MGDRYPFGKAPFWILVIAILSTLMLVSVQRERPPRPDLILVTFSGPQKAAYEKAVVEFEERHGVNVEVQFAHWSSLRARLQSAMLADTDVPDMVEMLEGSLGFFTRGPLEDIGILDLTERVEEENLKERMVASRFSLWSTRGRTFGLPRDVHPTMLAYRRDLVEALGIDVRKLDTWDKFVEVGRRITKDLDGDGVIDRYMIDLPRDGGHGRLMMLLQKGEQLFDAQGNVAFNTEGTAEMFAWYVEQLLGEQRIAYDCGWGQPFLKAISDGLALFYLTPDWRSYTYQQDLPKLAGKLALMPLPAWEKGGRRTTIWGGTGLVITKGSKNPELAWKLAKFLYLNEKDLGERFEQTNIVPSLKSAWDLPEFETRSAYFSNQPVGKMYAELASETPPQYSSPVDTVARSKLDEVYARVAEYYKDHGQRGLMEKIRAELRRAEEEVNRLARRNAVLAEAE